MPTTCQVLLGSEDESKKERWSLHFCFVVFCHMYMQLIINLENMSFLYIKVGSFINSYKHTALKIAKFPKQHLASQKV